MRYSIHALAALLLGRFILDGVLGEETGASRDGLAALLAPAALSYAVLGCAALMFVARRFQTATIMARQPLLLFIVPILLGAVFGAFQEQAITSTLIFVEFMIFFMLTAYCISEVLLQGQTAFARFESGIIAALATVVMTGVIDLMLAGPAAFSLNDRPRFQGTIVSLNPNVWGICASLLGVFASGRMIARPRLWSLNMVLTAFAGVLLYFSGSRAAMVGWVIGALTVLLTSIRNQAARVSLVLLLIAPVLLVSFVMASPELILSLRLSDEQELLSLSGRTKIWEWYLLELTQSPFIGIGLGYRRLAANTGLNMGEVIYISAHNSFITVWEVSGLLGLISFCAALASVEIRLLKSIGRQDSYMGANSKTIALGIFHALLAISIVEGALASTFPYFNVPFAYVLVVTYVAAQVKRGGRSRYGRVLPRGRVASKWELMRRSSGTLSDKHTRPAFDHAEPPC